MKFKQEQLESWAAGTNPMDEDYYHMGSSFAKDIMLLFPHHNTEELKYFIIVNTKTGERTKLTLETKD